MSRWKDPPFKVFPYYKSGNNQIVFPSGVLHPPFFDVTFPSAINFGSVGAFFAHELAHGFRASALSGDSTTTPHLSNATIQHFENRSRCLVDQYSKYCSGMGEIANWPRPNEKIKLTLLMKTIEMPMNTEMTKNTNTNRDDKYPVSIPTDYNDRTKPDWPYKPNTDPAYHPFRAFKNRLLAFKKGGRFLTIRCQRTKHWWKTHTL